MRYSEQARFSVEADLYRAKPVITGPAGPVTGAFEITVTFDKPVNDTSVPTMLNVPGKVFKVTNGTISWVSDDYRTAEKNADDNPFEWDFDDGRVYTYDVTPASSGQVTVGVLAGKFVYSGHEGGRLSGSLKTWELQTCY